MWKNIRVRGAVYLGRADTQLLNFLSLDCSDLTSYNLASSLTTQTKLLRQRSPMSSIIDTLGGSLQPVSWLSEVLATPDHFICDVLSSTDLSHCPFAWFSPVSLTFPISDPWSSFLLLFLEKLSFPQLSSYPKGLIPLLCILGDVTLTCCIIYHLFESQIFTFSSDFTSDKPQIHN